MASNPWKLSLELRLLGKTLNLLVAAVLAPGLELELPLEINSLECLGAGTDRETVQSFRASTPEPDCDQTVALLLIS